MQIGKRLLTSFKVFTIIVAAFIAHMLLFLAFTTIFSDVLAGFILLILSIVFFIFLKDLADTFMKELDKQSEKEDNNG